MAELPGIRSSRGPLDIPLVLLPGQRLTVDVEETRITVNVESPRGAEPTPVFAVHTERPSQVVIDLGRWSWFEI